jgi:hypothetical protein
MCFKSLIAFALSLTTSFACDIRWGVGANSNFDTAIPVVVVSVDHFDSTGHYKLTVPAFLGVFVLTDNAGCGITNLARSLPEPLQTMGGNPSPDQPLTGVNILLTDDKSGRPATAYPVLLGGTITATATDSSTGQQTTSTLQVFLIITKVID